MASHVDTDCFLVFARPHLRESVVALREWPPNDGLLDGGPQRYLDDRVLKWYGDSHHLSLFAFSSPKFRSPRNVLLSFRLASTLRARGTNIVHFVGNDLRQLLVRSFLPHTAFVHTIHDFVGHSGERRFWAERLNRHLARTSTVITHSRYVQRLILAECAGADVSMIPFGPLTVFRAFDRGLSPPGLAPGYALFFGRISPYKGIKLLIGATRLARIADPTLRLVVAGDGQWDQVGVTPGPGLTTFRHVLDNDELVALVKGAEFVVCPYTDATQSGVVMTAYAFGKPVIATRVGGLEEVVSHERTGLLVPPGDTQALADAMLLLHSDGSRVERFASTINALEKEGEYSWDHIARQTAEVYRQVAAPSHPSIGGKAR
jgi:glycosyltransferase involved in cell wall biosynthesis